jgi:hypothetical protein
MMRRTILLVATMALSLFAANCVLLLAQELTHPQRAEAMAANTGFSQDCQQSAVGNFDPIVFPNTPPGVDVGHRHAFFGSTAIRSDATLADLQAGTSNCTFRSTYPTTNNSAYWVPDLLLRSGTWAGIGRVEIYYRAGNLSDAEIAKMQAFPPGLKMIVDNVPESNVNWECAKPGDANNPQYHYPQNCADGLSGQRQVSSRSPHRLPEDQLRCPLSGAVRRGGAVKLGRCLHECSRRRLGSLGHAKLTGPHRQVHQVGGHLW